MKIDFTKDNGILNVVLDGRLDTTTAPELEQFLGTHYTATDTLILNCEKLTYVSSAGLRVLLTAQKKMKGSMKLTNVCELVLEVFEMTGFVDILVIE
ncbi:MAG: STAS domain-containing protein [Clostridia bacterium]|nr:STAS domain-containing protein [Clostridia bacterium]